MSVVGSLARNVKSAASPAVVHRVISCPSLVFVVLVSRLIISIWRWRYNYIVWVEILERQNLMINVNVRNHYDFNETTDIDVHAGNVWVRDWMGDVNSLVLFHINLWYFVIILCVNKRVVCYVTYAVLNQ